MAIKSAKDFFIDELKDIYSAEKQAIKAYPRMTKAVNSAELKEALQSHLEESKAQVERLDRVFELLEKRATGKTCEGMKGVLEESTEAIEEIEEKGALRDAALIAAAQRSEHYEIAAYGTALALAKAFGEDEIADLLAETLEEEKATDERLTELSKAINREALGEAFAGEDEENEEDEEDDEDEEEETEPAAADQPGDEDEDAEDEDEDVFEPGEGDEDDEEEDEEEEEEDDEEPAPPVKSAAKKGAKAAKAAKKSVR